MNESYRARVVGEAKAQFTKEKFNDDVEREKQRLRESDNRSFWQRIFPFQITIRRIK